MKSFFKYKNISRSSSNDLIYLIEFLLNIQSKFFENSWNPVSNLTDNLNNLWNIQNFSRILKRSLRDLMKPIWLQWEIWNLKSIITICQDFWIAELTWFQKWITPRKMYHSQFLKISVRLSFMKSFLVDLDHSICVDPISSHGYMSLAWWREQWQLGVVTKRRIYKTSLGVLKRVSVRLISWLTISLQKL